MLVIGSSEENFGYDQQHKKSKQPTPLQAFLASLSRSVASVTIRFAFELVHEGRCLA
jgi:hypothetical protein